MQHATASISRASAATSNTRRASAASISSSVPGGATLDGVAHSLAIRQEASSSSASCNSAGGSGIASTAVSADTGVFQLQPARGSTSIMQNAQKHSVATGPSTFSSSSTRPAQPTMAAMARNVHVQLSQPGMDHNQRPLSLASGRSCAASQSATLAAGFSSMQGPTRPTLDSASLSSAVTARPQTNTTAEHQILRTAAGGCALQPGVRRQREAALSSPGKGSSPSKGLAASSALDPDSSFIRSPPSKAALFGSPSERLSMRSSRLGGASGSPSHEAAKDKQLGANSTDGCSGPDDSASAAAVFRDKVQGRLIF